jgi:hypothetical protein
VVNLSPLVGMYTAKSDNSKTFLRNLRNRDSSLVRVRTTLILLAKEPVGPAPVDVGKAHPLQNPNKQTLATPSKLIRNDPIQNLS